MRNLIYTIQYELKLNVTVLIDTFIKDHGRGNFCHLCSVISACASCKVISVLLVTQGNFPRIEFRLRLLVLFEELHVKILSNEQMAPLVSWRY